MRRDPDPGWTDEVKRCGNCRLWSGYDMGSGSCNLDREQHDPVKFRDFEGYPPLRSEGGLYTHPNFYCIAWEGEADGEAQASA